MALFESGHPVLKGDLIPAQWIFPPLWRPTAGRAVAFVQDAMLDAVRKYPVDAVHFDDYFY
ncbi:family 10 glycosylhydrolase, partial [Streptomyces lincolnensis]|uniref:family 10 glycosylhydrolase n=1 Tax=Streptomyces lincolnensis TaxID=1915 RepID=UPI0033FE652B